MKTSDFSFHLPEALVAQYPPEKRGESRLLLLDRVTRKCEHRLSADLPEILCRREFSGKDGGKPLLVFNDSKVRKARLLGRSLQTGAEAEFLLLEQKGGIWKVMARRAKRRKAGSGYAFYDSAGNEAARAEITAACGEFRYLAFDRPIDEAWLDRYGHIPLPPYIRRQDESADTERYQTIYAAVPGSAAAPTAGLHFTRELLDKLAASGIASAFITLHVGLGTFLPVRCENIEDHQMHEERFFISDEAADAVEKAKEAGRKIIAVGTTSARTLESAWEAGRLRRGEQRTSIFIYPGCRFRLADALFTNFHTPESTLLMLVSAFAGKELILETYNEAIRLGYRFFSYGDAMLIR